MIRYLLILTIVMFAIVLTALPPSAAEPHLDGCNRLYHDGAYEAAISCYKEIGTSAELLFNIGNSYARLDQAGYAVLHYLRALCLDPGDSDTISNLNTVRKENSLFPPEPELVDQFFSVLTISQWSYLCLIALLFFLVFLVFDLRRKKGTGAKIFVAIISLAVFTLGAWGALNQYSLWQRSVVVEQTRLLISPFENAESAGTIQPGRLVTPHKNYLEFVYVTDEMGRKGWVKKEHQEPIIAQEKK